MCGRGSKGPGIKKKKFYGEFLDVKVEVSDMTGVPDKGNKYLNFPDISSLYTPNLA